METKTVLILGAGASKALNQGFGLGQDLLQDISDRVTDRTSPTRRNLSALLESVGFNETITKEFVKHLDAYKNAVPAGTIDGFLDEIRAYPEFIHQREEFEQIGRFAITFHVLGYEGKLLENGVTTPSWIDYVAEYIQTNGITKPGSRHKLRIITFNYDRTVEHLLYNHVLFKDKEQIRDYLGESIVHVYGKIANLEWQRPDNYAVFGAPNDNYQLIFQNKVNIHIVFPDRMQNNDGIQQARNWLGVHGLEDEVRICSMGFGFDHLNCRLLNLQGLPGTFTNIRMIYNIFPGNGGDFANRRFAAEKIRKVNHQAELTYTNCADFVKYVLIP